MEFFYSGKEETEVGLCIGFLSEILTTEFVHDYLQHEQEAYDEMDEGIESKCYKTQGKYATNDSVALKKALENHECCNIGLFSQQQGGRRMPASLSVPDRRIWVGPELRSACRECFSVKICLVCTKVEAGELTSQKYSDLSLDHHHNMDF